MTALRTTPLTALRPGDRAEETIQIDPETVRACVSFSGDDNPVHLSDEFASAVGFDGAIAHGLVQLGLLSKLIGTSLPGHGAVWSALDLAFSAPVYVGDRLTIGVTVRQVSPAARALVLDVAGRAGGRDVLRGSVRVRVPEPAARG